MESHTYINQKRPAQSIDDDDDDDNQEVSESCIDTCKYRSSLSEEGAPDSMSHSLFVCTYENVTSRI